MRKSYRGGITFVFASAFFLGATWPGPAGEVPRQTWPDSLNIIVDQNISPNDPSFPRTVNAQIQFRSGYPSGSVEAAYQLDWGDGSPIVSGLLGGLHFPGVVLAHYYAESGPYELTVTGTASLGGNLHDTKHVLVGKEPIYFDPVLNFNPTVGPNPLLVKATVQQIPEDVDVLRLTWYFYGFAPMPHNFEFTAKQLVDIDSIYTTYPPAQVRLYWESGEGVAWGSQNAYILPPSDSNIVTLLSPTPSPIPSPSPTRSPSPTPSPTPSASPTASPIPTPKPSSSPTPSPIPSPTPVPSPSPTWMQSVTDAMLGLSGLTQSQEINEDSVVDCADLVWAQLNS